MTPTHNPASDDPATQSVEENPPEANGFVWDRELWDGLSDEQGPIPAFGPAKTDKTGRLVKASPEEEAARRDAIRRMLKVIGDITDETDTDELWDEFDRAMKRAD